MIFYDCATAPSPRRARMFIAEKGVEVETRQVSMRSGEQLSQAFRAINPRATIPVLVTPKGTVLTENIGIATYLEAAFPEPALMGRTPDERGEILMWSAICEAQGGGPIADALRNGNPAMKDRAVTGPENHAQIPELAVRGMTRAEKFFDILEERLQDAPNISGASFGLADITGYVLVDFARVIKLRVTPAHPRLFAWYERMGTRPSAAL